MDDYETQKGRILIKVHDYLNLNKNGSIIQEPYKSDFFKIFSEAYRSGFCGTKYRINKLKTGIEEVPSKKPKITSYDIVEYLKENNWYTQKEIHIERKEKLAECIGNWWDEWTYAWDKNPSRR